MVRALTIVLALIAACGPRNGPYVERAGEITERGTYWHGLRDGVWTADSRTRPLWRVTYVHGKREGACFLSTGNGGAIEGTYHEDRRQGPWHETAGIDCVQGDEVITEGGRLGHAPGWCKGFVEIVGNYVNDERDGEWRFGTAIVTFHHGHAEVPDRGRAFDGATVFGQGFPGSIVAIGDQARLVGADESYRLVDIKPGRYPVINADARQWMFWMVDVGAVPEVDARGPVVLHDISRECPPSR